MGEMGDFFLEGVDPWEESDENFMNDYSRYGNDEYNPKRRRMYISTYDKHPLDCEYWCAKDGRRMYPAKGNMDEQYIRNVMAFIRKPETIKKLQKLELEYFMKFKPPTTDLAMDAYEIEYMDVVDLSTMEPGEYFNNRIRHSILWRTLRKGLTYHYNLKQEANKLNEGVLKL